MKVLVNKINKHAILPHYEHNGDAGMDIYSTESFTLKPNEIKLVSTGLRIALPKGFEAQIRPKSGLAINHGIGVLNSPGTIDSGYRGELKIILFNFSKNEFIAKEKTKIAQIVFNKIEQAEIEIVEELDETTRGENGFGSTGLVKK